MTDMNAFKKNPQKHLLEQLSEARCVMLGSPNPSEHMQPMSPQLDEDLIENHAGTVYFYSDRSSDLGKAVLANPTYVMMTYMTKDYQTCANGYLSAVTESGLVERFWNPIVASWYPGGTTDENMLMLKFEIREAAIWASSGNPLNFLYETAKANLTDTTPDVGGRAHIKVA